ncbi:GNAT family N-acetyltransferase [Naasia aerilata]|uniref:Alanine acetyltransferase n=1 Tax=Naasia aerilata TaxID=1162966 RepID=A0ABN6XK48_9MICO|nr:GNAT family protein [Naasia aerilata]BDZ45267.1 alanine acetyltransferase [Naasia aerilata]
MTAQPLSREPLVGRFVRLAPMQRADLPELFAAIGRPEVFAGGYGGGPAGYRDTADGFAAFAERYYLWDNAGISYVVRRIEDGAVVGTSTLGDVDLANEAIHLGWTAYAPEVWGTVVNPETKLLMLGHAFASGFGRVKLQADVLNERSRAAILKLGATFEGISRRDKRRADGSWRDSAVHSILVDEWPEVRERLERRVASFAPAASRLSDERSDEGRG